MTNPNTLPAWARMDRLIQECRLIQSAPYLPSYQRSQLLTLALSHLDNSTAVERAALALVARRLVAGVPMDLSWREASEFARLTRLASVQPETPTGLEGRDADRYINGDCTGYAFWKDSTPCTYTVPATVAGLSEPETRTAVEEFLRRYAPDRWKETRGLEPSTHDWDVDGPPMTETTPDGAPQEETPKPTRKVEPTDPVEALVQRAQELTVPGSSNPEYAQRLRALLAAQWEEYKQPPEGMEESAGA